MPIKIFSNQDIKVLEEQVNEFTTDKDVLQVSSGTLYDRDCILVYYRDKPKK